MKHLELYTPDICSQLRQIAEVRQWRDWRRHTHEREAIEKDIELTYHLHAAAEASGARKGMPPMPPCPIHIHSDHSLDPAEFIAGYRADCN
jgi:hypothetical protein